MDCRKADTLTINSIGIVAEDILSQKVLPRTSFPAAAFFSGKPGSVPFGKGILGAEVFRLPGEVPGFFVLEAVQVLVGVEAADIQFDHGHSHIGAVVGDPLHIGQMSSDGSHIIK